MQVVPVGEDTENEAREEECISSEFKMRAYMAVAIIALLARASQIMPSRFPEPSTEIFFYQMFIHLDHSEENSLDKELQVATYG